jgi:hypothetical protein
MHVPRAQAEGLRRVGGHEHVRAQRPGDDRVHEHVDLNDADRDDHRPHQGQDPPQAAVAQVPHEVEHEVRPAHRRHLDQNLDHAGQEDRPGDKIDPGDRDGRVVLIDTRE